MAIFGIKTIFTPALHKFMEESNERLKSESILDNPFKGVVKIIKRIDSNIYYGIDITPIYPPVPLAGALFMVIPLIFTGWRWSWWLLPGAVFLALGVLWSKYFFYGVLRLGLRKKGIRQKIRLLRNNELLKVLIND